MPNKQRLELTWIGKNNSPKLEPRILIEDPEKNELLKRVRGISFEEIAYLIGSDQILGIETNPGRSNQKIYILEIGNYAVVIPFAETEDEIFLKTAFPGRKFTKRSNLKGELWND